jgi:UDP-N-acetylmuramoyl-tripeptide--D-alanyl-D-alanine ligase
VRYRVADIPALLRTPVGRSQLVAGVDFRAWPASAALARGYRGTAARRVCVVAVVGSLGKTTTARAVRAALGVEDHRPERDNHFGHVARSVLSVSPWSGAGVVEVGIAKPGEMRRYARVVRPDVAVVTSVASEHNRSLGSLDRTREEKEEMVRALPRSGVAVLNADDPNVLAMAGATGARVVTYGVAGDADVRATDVSLDWPRGTVLRARVDGREWPLRTRLLGPPGVSAILAALAVASVRGVPMEDALARLAELPPTPMRLEPVPLPNGAILLRDEFKSALETIGGALDLLERVPAERRIAVIGEVSEPPGSQGPIYGEVGARLAAVCERVFVVGRTFTRYAAGARRSSHGAGMFVDCGPIPARAVELLRDEIRAGDVVLLKGRDTQRLDRIALALLGREVGCALDTCDAPRRCASCGMLARGWSGLRPVGS